MTQSPGFVKHPKYQHVVKQAGKLAARAGAKRFELFHFSPRYQGRERELKREATEGYRSMMEQLLGSQGTEKTEY